MVEFHMVYERLVRNDDRRTSIRTNVSDTNGARDGEIERLVKIIKNGMFGKSLLILLLHRQICSSSFNHSKRCSPSIRLDRNQHSDTLYLCSSSLRAGSQRIHSHKMTTETLDTSKNPPETSKEVTNTMISKMERLSSQSSVLATLSVTEKLAILEEMIQLVKRNDWSCTGNWLHHEMALLKLIDPSKSVNDVHYSSHTKNIKGLMNFLFGFVLLEYLEMLQKRLEMELDPNSNSMKSIMTSKEENIAGIGTIQIHGPFKVPYVLQKFELWSFPDSNEEEENEDEEHSPLLSPETTPLSPKQEGEEGGIALVLGGGNQSFISAMDTLHCLFVHPCKPVLIKHHPLRPYLYDLYDQLFQPLISRRYVEQIIDPGLEVNQALLARKEVSHIHITGSMASVNNIKTSIAASRGPAASVPITSELGNVTPFIISPGHYTRRELRNAAMALVTSKKSNAGCNCLSAQALILPRDWEQKDQFRQILMKELKTTPTDPLYYPGSAERCRSMVSHYKNLGEERVITLDAPKSCNPHDPSLDEWFVHPFIVECGVPGTDDYDGHAIQNESFGNHSDSEKILKTFM